MVFWMPKLGSSTAEPRMEGAALGSRVHSNLARSKKVVHLTTLLADEETG